MRQRGKVMSDTRYAGGQPTLRLTRGGKHLCSTVRNGIEHSRRMEHAPILLSTTNSFCPSFDATRISNDLLRCASGSRASRISITTSALSRTAARCGRSGLRSSGAPLASVVEAEPGVLFAVILPFVDFEGFFVRPSSVATPWKAPSSPSVSSLFSPPEPSPLSIPFALTAAFCCARSTFFSSLRRAFASAAYTV